MRVLHSVSTYLHISENWIYPQVVRVPNVKSLVVCNSVANNEIFPLGHPLVLGKVPPWSYGLGLPRVFYAVAWRLGWREPLLELKLRWWRPQILHAHFGMRGWESLALSKRLKVPSITSFYGFDAWLMPRIEPVWQKRYMELFAAGDVFLVEGSAMRSRLLELGCPGSKICIHRIGVDLAARPFAARNFSDGLNVLMVGRFVEKKGLSDGLRACALARSCGAKLSVTIIGDAVVDDPVGQEIKRELYALRESPELSGCVRFAGFLPLAETRLALASHNVFLCPSRHSANGDGEGGSPVVLTEAMASGLLCIGTWHCDIPEVIVNNRTGYLCGERDVKAMAEVLLGVSAAPDAQPELTREGRQHTEQEFSLTRQLGKLYGIYGLTRKHAGL
jgi:colanic acid/amylovoran biosynthesis glycosyltransferase